jgi:hypothetical protein
MYQYRHFQQVISFKHSYATSTNDILHADGGLFLHPAALTVFLAAGLDFHSYVSDSVITRVKVNWV